jgi:hypothetical protein
LEGFESPSEVVGCDEVGQMPLKVIVAVLEEAFDGGFLDGAIHPLDLAVRPEMIWLGEPVFDATAATHAVEGMSAEACRWSLAVLRQVGELDAVVGEHSVDAVRHGFDERLEEGGSGPHVRLLNDLDHRELGGAVDGDEQGELAFGGPHLGQVDVEEADRIGIELFPPGLVAFNVRQPADAMTFQATVKRRAGELRDRGLKSVETVIQRQQRVLAKRNDDSFLLDRKDRGSRNGWAGATIGGGLALLPLGDRLLVDAMTTG